MLTRRNKISVEHIVNITINGKLSIARAGESVASAVLASQHFPTRHNPVSGKPRAPYCLMGSCFECLMNIDGSPNKQACLVTVAEGMSVRLQSNRPSVEELDEN